MQERINMVIASPTDTINNVYELPSMERAVRYLHGAAGFPTKATWVKAIRNGAYVSWPLINIKNVNKYFPESEETQKGHIQNLHQYTRSNTRVTNKRTPTVPPAPQHILSPQSTQPPEPPESPANNEPTEETNDVLFKCMILSRLLD